MLDVDTRRALVAVLERKFNLNQLRDPGGEGGGRWIKALADILDDVSFEALDGTEVYVGIREDGVMDLGIGTKKNSPVARFSRHDVQAIHDAAYAMWRKRGDDQDENGLIDDTIVDTKGQRIYLAISEKQTYTADPGDEDDEDEFGPVLTLGIPTPKDSDESPDFHKVDLDEEGFDNLVDNLEAFRDNYEQVEVETESISDNYDLVLMSDHRIHLAGSHEPPPAYSLAEAEQVAAAIDRLMAVAVPDFDGDDPDALDGEDIKDRVSVSLLEDGSFSLSALTEDDVPVSAELDRDEAEQLADSLKTMIQKDRGLPGARGIPGVPVTRSLVERKFNLNQLRDPGGEGGGRWIKNPASGAIGKLADKLGLATKKRNLIQLADGEELVGSDVFKSAGGVEFLLAATRRADGSRTIRMATGVEDKADWGANNRGGTAVLDERGVGRLRNELDRMGEAEKEFKDEYKTAEKQYEEAKTTQYQLMRQKHPDLAAHQWHEIEDLDDDIQGIPNNIDMINDRIDERAGDLPSELYDDWLQLEAELAKLAPDSPARAALYDRQAVLLDELPAQRWGSSPGDGYRSDLRDLAKNQERLDYAVARRRDLLSLSMAELSAADTDALDEAETVRNDAWAELTGDLAELTLVDGTVSGDWTNVGFLTDTDEQGDVRHHVEVRPTDAPDDWYPGYDGSDSLTPADLRKLSAKLAAMIAEGGGVERSADFTPSLHLHGPDGKFIDMPDLDLPDEEEHVPTFADFYDLIATTKGAGHHMALVRDQDAWGTSPTAGQVLVVVRYDEGGRSKWDEDEVFGAAQFTPEDARQVADALESLKVKAKTFRPEPNEDGIDLIGLVDIPGHTVGAWYDRDGNLGHEDSAYYAVDADGANGPEWVQDPMAIFDNPGEKLTLFPEDVAGIVKGLRTLADQAPTEGGDVEPTASRTIPYDPPHAPAGSPTGGQFTTGGGGSKGKPQPRGRQSKTRPRKRAQPGSVLAYDPKTNQGTGYGSKNGDERVHTLQQSLNKFGITDADGKELRDDGKLGPKTTAAVKKLQKALGLTPNGKVTPAMLQLLKTADSMAALKKAVAAAKGAKKPMPARTYRSLSRSGPLLFDRTFVLDDIQISRSGDGRTVEAYAAMFGSPYEVRDEHGHYYEVIDRSAFNRTLNGAGKNAMCLYNHGMTVHGTPSELGSVPLGTPLEIKPDGKGLLTVTRYNKGPFADQVLESIRNGDIKAQSFRGRIVRSDPTGRIPRSSYGRPLPTVTRHELGLTDYGPTPVPVNDQAEIVAVRSVLDLIDDFASLSPDERDELLRHLDVPTLDGGPGIEDLEDLDEEPDGEPAGDDTATSDHSEPGTEEPPAERSDAGHSGRFVEFRRDIRTAMVIRGM